MLALVVVVVGVAAVQGAETMLTIYKINTRFQVLPFVIYTYNILK